MTAPEGRTGMRRRERYPDLIDELEREVFPFQESEEEQESFTPEGRKRVDDWLHVLSRRRAFFDTREGRPR